METCALKVHDETVAAAVTLPLLPTYSGLISPHTPVKPPQHIYSHVWRWPAGPVAQLGWSIRRGAGNNVQDLFNTTL